MASISPVSSPVTRTRPLTEHTERSPQELGAADLDDERDRDELRDRYDMLLQEHRVLLPGVQVLVAFLLTMPFADGYEQVDDLGKVLYGVSLMSGMLAIVAFVAPAAFHRLGSRRARSERLEWGIRMTRTGIACMSLAFEAALLVVLSVVFDYRIATVCAVCIGVVGAAVWIVLPRTMRTD